MSGITSIKVKLVSGQTVSGMAVPDQNEVEILFPTQPTEKDTK